MTISAGHTAGLAYDLSVPDGAGEGATVAVLLHGRGSHKGDLQALGPLLPDNWILVTPQAPFPGAEWGYGEGWAWYRYVEDDGVAPETLAESVTLLDGFLDALADVVGVTPGRIVLGGFSQGGTTSLAYALQHPGVLTAVLNFSGFLAAGIEAPGPLPRDAATPVFWGHGVKDGNIPIALAERGRQRLEAAGVPLLMRTYPIGHWMHPDAVHEALAMVRQLS